MNFINSIKICYTKKYAKFEGRASRSEFWYFILFYYGIIALTIWVDVNYLNKPLVKKVSPSKVDKKADPEKIESKDKV